jgi:hypothetical protein
LPEWPPPHHERGEQQHLQFWESNKIEKSDERGKERRKQIK